MEPNMTNNERLARLETLVEVIKESLSQDRVRSEEILQTLMSKIDVLDSKIEARFQTVESHAQEDAKELQALKNKGAGVLASVGVIFTATATIFSDFFSSLKHSIFG